MPDVLSVRNVTSDNAGSVDNKPKSLDYHRQVLASRMNDDQGGNTAYISPSDEIMSPASQKLSAMKNKHFKKGKPQSLFAKTSLRNAEKSGLDMEAKPENTEGEGKMKEMAEL